MADKEEKKAASKFKGYVARPEVKELYRTITSLGLKKNSDQGAF